MKKPGLRQMLQIVVIILIAFVSFQILADLIHQVKELSTDYHTIDPYLSESPDLRVPGGYLTIQEEVMESSPKLAKSLAIRASVINNLNGILHLILSLLVLISILQLIKTWNFSHFFIQNNYRIFRRIAYLYLGWLLCYFVLYMSISILFSYDTITHYYNVSAIHLQTYGTAMHNLRLLLSSIFRTLGKSIDSGALFVFFMMFIMSITLKEGIKLQDQADLTI